MSYENLLLRTGGGMLILTTPEFHFTKVYSEEFKTWFPANLKTRWLKDCVLVGKNVKLRNK